MQRKTAPCNHSVCHKCVRRSTVARRQMTKKDLTQRARRYDTEVAEKKRVKSATMRSLERGITLRTILIATLISICGAPCLAQKRAPIPPAQGAQEVRNDRIATQERIIRDLTDIR